MAFAPDLASGNVGFDAELFEKLAPLEADNFWFTSRSRLLLWSIETYFPKLSSFMEIGCGTGYVLSEVRRQFPEVRLFGSEVQGAGLSIAKQRIKECTLLQMDARRIPFEREFDVIGAFDVLEHIVEDELVLREIYRAVQPGGGIILTVPQHPFLWSAMDEFACHVRRYSARDLVAKVQAAGFSVVRETSFVSLPLPLMIASRYRRRGRENGHDQLAELKVGRLSNAFLKGVLRAEHAMIRMGVSMPIGGSLLLVARKER